MKKTTGIILLLMVILTGFFGCAGQSSDANTASKIDIRDMDGIYEFVKQEMIQDLSREDFDLWEANYLDITGNGTDEVILAGVYGVEWPQKMIVVSGDSGQYKEVPSDILLYKYENTPGLQDGFFTVNGRTGGTGTESAYMSINKYNGSEIINIAEIEMSYRGNAENVDEKRIAEIEGSLNDFTYTSTFYDNIKGTSYIGKKEKYSFNESEMSYDIQVLEVKNPDAGQTSNQSDQNPNQSNQVQLNDFYAANVDYDLYDLNKTGEVDYFNFFKSSVDTPLPEIYLIINGTRYEINGLVPELVDDEYQIVKNTASGGYVFVFSESDPLEPQYYTYFYEYSPNYALEILGYVRTDKELQYLDINNLNYTEVEINQMGYSLQFN